MISQLTLLDWAILTFPVLWLILGISNGGIAMLLSGVARLLIALVAAQIPVLYVQTRTGLPGATARLLGVDIGVARLIVGVIVFIAALLVILRLLAWLRGVLSGVLRSHAVGRLLDQLIGIPAGLLVGILLSVILIVVPVLVMKRMVPSGRTISVVERSVLLPAFERRLQVFVRGVLGPGVR